MSSSVCERFVNICCDLREYIVGYILVVDLIRKTSNKVKIRDYRMREVEI